ncbi:MAG: hypothetical protein ABSF69_04420 [Polyangiaceae bacterium]|jgi:hypothetical protein
MPGMLADSQMTSEVAEGRELSPRIRRALELSYGVEGVVAARVWQWPGRVAVGVRGGNATSAPELIRRVEAAVAGLRETGETWDFGILEDPTK